RPKTSYVCHGCMNGSRDVIFPDSYRGQVYIEKLERWIDTGQHKILITGESGAGKSALIANWMEAHHQAYPEDFLYAHHLGCSNDASAIRPMLARLIETAKQQLPEVYSYSLQVPQDWWELVAKAAEALQSLGRWAKQNNHRWIWILDGLDRLNPDDQNALPWLPLAIPDGVLIVASALECPTKEILVNRKFNTLTIRPLQEREQRVLVKQYLGRYAKQLVAELRIKILSHPLAGSPLFLRVLLEELRQCGRYDTLAEQLDGYLTVVTIDDLYERVLERLEEDGNGENVRKVMTALWASKAGLSEEELLSIKGLASLEWVPIDLALKEAFGRNGNLLLIDHDYLRKAVENRYLTCQVDRQQAHSDIAQWFEYKDEWDVRKSEELPWQLLRAFNGDLLLDILSREQPMLSLLRLLDPGVVYQYWIQACCQSKNKRSIETAIQSIFDSIKAKSRAEQDNEVTLDIENLLGLLKIAGGGDGNLALKTCRYYLEIYGGNPGTSLQALAIKETLADCSRLDDKLDLYANLVACYREHYPDLIYKRLRIELKTAKNYAISGKYDRANELCKLAEAALQSDSSISPPVKIELNYRLSDAYMQMFNEDAAIRLMGNSEKICDHCFGSESLAKLDILIFRNLVKGENGSRRDIERSKEALELCRARLGAEHPRCIACLESYTINLQKQNKVGCTEKLLELKERRYGKCSGEYLFSYASYGVFFIRQKKAQRAHAILADCYELHCSFFGKEAEPTLAAAFYYSIACLLLGKDVEGIELFANALLISVSSLKAGFYAKNDEVLERIDDLAGWFGAAFKGSRLYQRRTVIRLFTEALKRQEQISS
ncbi:ATP-binding protein, partial [Cyanobium sp. A1C-AMD]|uniref:ATP-binding protein n=1 Tax=Cyanobium sp. A1C-AMD TaxID=2823694 RepID=UPI0020CD170A